MQTATLLLAAWLAASVAAAALWSARHFARQLRPAQAAADWMVTIVIGLGGAQLAALLGCKAMGWL